MYLLIPAFAAVLAGVIGFAAHRASLCSVRAVEEVLTTRRAFMLVSFIKTAMWVVGATLLITWLVPVSLVPVSGWKLSAFTLLGGFMFGVGATINGGCAFSTLTRLGSGNMGMIVSLTGFVTGAGVYGAISAAGLVEPATATPAVLSTHGIWRTPVTIVLAIWMMLELARLVRSVGMRGWKDRALASRYRMSTAAVLMGLSNAVLYISVGAWTYTQLLSRTAQHAIFGDPPAAILMWVLFAALLLGVGLSARQSARFHWSWRPTRGWVGYGAGGIMMGFGAAMIPGGNDVLILNGIPSLSPHALPAFVAMLIGIAISLTGMRALGADIPRIDCGNDICEAGTDA